MTNSTIVENPIELQEQTKLNTAKSKLRKLRDELNNKYYQRSIEIDLCLIAYLIKEHIYLGGPPGTGKTSLAKDIASAMESNSFYYLMSKTTTIDEILGAIDIKALNQGVLKRDLSRGVANAEIVILDEGFKANSICLNTMLGLMLDREVVNAGVTVPTPLRTMIVCSNELPESEVLAPFWDRLSFRCWVKNISRANKRRMMWREVQGKSVTITTQIDAVEQQELLTAIDSITIEKETIKNIVKITAELEQDLNLIVSTRKHNQLIKILQACAFINDRDTVDEEDLNYLEFILWDELEQIEKIKEIIARFASPLKLEISNLLSLAESEFKEVKPYDGGESRSVWSTFKSKKEIAIEEILEQLTSLSLTNPNLADKLFYTNALNSVKSQLKEIALYSQEAYK